MPTDADFMRRTLHLAEKGWGQTAPNPMVGALVVRDGHVVGEGWHERFGAPHAEVNALRAAGEQGRGATLYVSLEPCRHHGKTPPCTDAILAAGIKRVVIATLDPTADAGGGGALLQTRGVAVQRGVLEREARELNASFIHAAANDTPWTTLKIAASLDMAIADRRGTTTWLTSDEARADVHRMRAGHDAIAVGVGTVLADDPQLTARVSPPPRVPPTRVIFDRRLRTPLGSRVVTTARETPTTILTSDDGVEAARALRDAGVRVLPASDLHDAMRVLRQENVRSLMIEGGAAINSATLSAGIAHRLVIFQAPVVLGPNALYAFDGAPPDVRRRLEQLRVLDRRVCGPDVRTTYALAEL